MRSIVGAIAILLLLICLPSNYAEDHTFTLGDVLQLSTREQLHRGTLQRPAMFLDIVGSRKHLEVALVIDGTDSMGQEFKSVVKELGHFVEGIQVQKDLDSEIRFALVVFRDDKSPSGPCQIPIPEFTTDSAEFMRALSEQDTEDGTPYFNEMVDVGVHQAITRLNWSSGKDDVTRWIILCGDSPPYNAGKGLKHSALKLAQIANERGVEIYSILCNSGFTTAKAEKARDLLETAKEEAPYARRFMSELANQTHGKFMDLWNPDVVKQLLGLVKDRQTFQQRLKRISNEELIACRARAKRNMANGGVVPGTVTLAILPHAPLNAMSFESDDIRVQTATEFRARFRSIAGVEVVTSAKTEAKYKALDFTQNESRILAEFSDAVQADYVIWGEIDNSSTNKFQLQTAMYNGTDGTLIAKASKNAEKSNGEALTRIHRQSAFKLCNLTAQSLKMDNVAEDVVAAFGSVKDDEKVSQSFSTQFASDIRAHRAILSGLSLLERSLAHEKGSDKNRAIDLLRDAETHLVNALQFESGNAFAHLLLANCYQNLGNVEEADDYSNKIYDNFRKAYRNRESMGGPESAARIEIEADHALLVNREVKKAIELYERLADIKDVSNARFSLRANWMLAGIYLGDWRVKEQSSEFVSVDKARNHIVQILAHWQDSDEASFYRDAMDSRVDEEYADIEVGKIALSAP